MTDAKPCATISRKRILQTWWPLAMSWFLMALELPALSAVLARMSEPKINLAAYGGIVFPMALIIEAPIIMLLAASTALSKDWQSYRKIRKFMHVVSGSLTFVHIVVVATPLYYFIAEDIIGAPSEIIDPARLGLALMLPWTWSVAYRRFNQGVLIRYQHTGTIGKGTLIRLSADLTVLLVSYFSDAVPGIAAAAGAVALGVVAEAVYIGIKVQPVLTNQLKQEPVIRPELNRRTFLSFYTPLALTSLITLLSQPLISAALSRMPRALDSLAVWPVLSGLLFILRSPGVAYNEVVVSLIGEPGAFPGLRRFAGQLAAATTALLLFVAATPLSDFWFEDISALPPSLISLASTAMWFGLLAPGANALQSWFQGLIVHSRKTRGIPEAVALFLLVTTGIYVFGIRVFTQPGIYIGVLGFSAGMIVQAVWLWFRSRPAVVEIQQRSGK